jgi:hypothetical protein
MRLLGEVISSPFKDAKRGIAPVDIRLGRTENDRPRQCFESPPFP